MVFLTNFIVQASDGGIREATLIALKGVMKHAGKTVSSAVRTRVYTYLKDLIHHEDDQVRMSAASILGVISQVLCNFYELYIYIYICKF